MTEIVVDPTMVERVAEAIWMENRPDGAPPYGELDFLDQGRVKMIARACIKAMREPTLEMCQRAMDDVKPYDDLGAIWKCMIDEALKED